MNPEIVELSKDHINHNGYKPYSNTTGLPGLHAEIQSVNYVFNYLDPKGENYENTLSNIQVATYKLQKDSKKVTPAKIVQGKEFVACKNCKGILRKPIKLIIMRAD